MKGLVIKAQSGFFTVQPDDGGEPIISRIRGRLKQARQESSHRRGRRPGHYRDQRDGTGNGAVGRGAPSALSRTRVAAQDRSLDTDREQVLVANPDQVVFVFSVANPAFSPRKLDRFLVVAEMNQLPAIICANKVDLVTRKRRATCSASTRPSATRYSTPASSPARGSRRCARRCAASCRCWPGRRAWASRACSTPCRRGWGCA
jgi:putative ribosome biogenesis GTPase RsgA